jgi:hypothetical protein
MEWLKIPHPERWRVSDGGRYLLRKLVTPAGECIGYGLVKTRLIDIYPSAEAATQAIMTRTGRMAEEK